MQPGEDPLSLEFLDRDPAKPTVVVSCSRSTPLPGNSAKKQVTTRDGTITPGRVSTSASIPPSSPLMSHRSPPPSLLSSSGSIVSRSPLSPTASARAPRVDILRESRIHQTFQYPGSGQLKPLKVGFAEYGPVDGHPAFVIGGHGCTRLVGVMFEELAMRYNIHMIWPERPGYGLSEECNAQEFNAMAWAEVIIQLADNLNIRRFSIIAQSVGTVFAMATAQKYPNRVLGPLFLISPWVSTHVANTFKWSRRLPAALVTRTVSLALDVIWMFNKPAQATPMSKDNAQDEADQRSTFSETSPRSSEATSSGKQSTMDVSSWMTALEEDELLASFEEDDFDLPTDFPPHRPLRHAVRPRHMSLYFAMNQLRMSEPHSQGQLLDVLIALEKYHPFGFNYSDIKMAVTAVWGDKDGLIPLRAIEALANGLRDVRLKILDGEGHDLVWKEGVMEWALRGTSERWQSRIRAVKAMSTSIQTATAAAAATTTSS